MATYTDSAKKEERTFWVRVKKRQENLNIDGMKHIFQGKRELRISWIMVLNHTIQHHASVDEIYMVNI